MRGVAHGIVTRRLGPGNDETILVRIHPRFAAGDQDPVSVRLLRDLESESI